MTAQEPKTTRLGDLLDEYNQFADKLEEARKTGKPFGPVTGLSTLDEQLGGAFQPGLHVVTASPGVGKTAFCLQLACNCGCPAFYVSCEMKPLILFQRIISRVTETRIDVLRNTALRDTGVVLPASKMKQLAITAVSSAPDLSLVDASVAFADPDWITREADTQRKAAGSAHTLIVIDSLHSWVAGFRTADGKTLDEYQRLTFAVDALRKVSSTLNSPVIYISEISKDAMKQHEKGQSAGLSGAAGNRIIQYQADSVMSLETKLNDGEPVKNDYGLIPVTLRFTKNRNGSPGRKVYLTFDELFQRFEEVKG
jgi:replicative DNA helicase